MLKNETQQRWDLISNLLSSNLILTVLNMNLSFNLPVQNVALPESALESRVERTSTTPTRDNSLPSLLLLSIADLNKHKNIIHDHSYHNIHGWLMITACIIIMA